MSRECPNCGSQAIATIATGLHMCVNCGLVIDERETPTQTKDDTDKKDG